ncbi:MAG TPA: zf-HC2 domain-containing protein [Acidimicrobiales bacterium]|nr:zf-HC2 domain-containing protein [Acidimicrobiales bacterium]
MTVPAGPPGPDLSCRELVASVTDYLDGALPDDRRALVDAHLATCEGCRHVLAQWREVVRLGGRLGEAEVGEVAPDVRDGLVAAFRRRHGRP